MQQAPRLDETRQAEIRRQLFLVVCLPCLCLLLLFLLLLFLLLLADVGALVLLVSSVVVCIVVVNSVVVATLVLGLALNVGAAVAALN